LLLQCIIQLTLVLFQHDIVVGFSRMGTHTSMGYVIKQYSVYNVPVFVVGGIPRGHFSDVTKKLAHYIV
ncbi:MAG: hypothetical protein QW453_05255, partial [Thermoprotei archaeon]